MSTTATPTRDNTRLTTWSAVTVGTQVVAGDHSRPGAPEVFKTVAAVATVRGLRRREDRVTVTFTDGSSLPGFVNRPTDTVLVAR